ncbi:hypothetical protein [Hyunsoonleella aestuarii]|uniref:TonB-dependent receptor n=1 Tax=Hyunsoonleella aestuarii TaxID=912802 RepID=A0ABP8EEN4_9FLAO|nr:hypothetical protein [Hyunsoonleella aestuarii]
MKTRFYILIVLLLSFTLGNAQSEAPIVKEEVKTIVSQTEINDDAVIIDSLELKEVIARTSDIRSFLNRERKVENIKLVFPKINKARKA